MDLQNLRVVLVESHEIARRGLHDMLASVAGSVVSVDAPQAAKDALAEADADVLLVSADVDESDLHALSDSRPKLRVLLLIRSTEPAALAAAARFPAGGYLMEPNLTIETLADALGHLGNGGTPMPRALAGYLVEQARSGDATSDEPSLTPRERQVLELLTEGLSNKEIARRLGISDHGAKRHVGNVLAKLNVSNRTLAAARAIRSGL